MSDSILSSYLSAIITSSTSSFTLFKIIILYKIYHIRLKNTKKGLKITMHHKENRTEKINIRITHDEKLILEQTARESGMSFSRYIRSLVFPDSPQNINPEVYDIQFRLQKNQLINLLQHSNCPEKCKASIIQELKKTLYKEEYL